MKKKKIDKNDPRYYHENGKVKTTKVRTVMSLPETMVQDIKALGLSRVQYNKALKFVALLGKMARKKRYSSYGQVALSSVYITKTFNDTYPKFLNPLRASGIVVCDHKYWFGDYGSKVHNYRLNPKYKEDQNLKVLEYQVEVANHKIKRKNRERIDFIQDIKKIDLDTEELKKISEKRIQEVSIDNHKQQEDVEGDRLNICYLTSNGYESRYVTTKEKALATAKKHNLRLIQDGDLCYITEPSVFVATKREYYRTSDFEAIKKLEKGIFYAGRNSTNNRLDTNLTNLAGCFVDHIKKKNNLVEIDLSNSQFAIFCHITKGLIIGPDYDTFKDLAVSGKLYEFIQEKLGLKTRKEAKQLTFELLFSSHRNKNPLLNQLREWFPNVIDWITEYKKKYGDNQFSIMLQKKEAEMFVTDMYPAIKGRGLFCLTKHDCFIVRKEDEQEVRMFMTAYFDSIGFDGVLK